MALQEVLPSLVQVVNQPLRPVAQHLFTPQEKITLAFVVATLVGYALTFDLGQNQPMFPEASRPAASAHTPMSPPVHTLSTFPVSTDVFNTAAVLLFCYGTRQLHSIGQKGMTGL